VLAHFSLEVGMVTACARLHVYCHVCSYVDRLLVFSVFSDAKCLPESVAVQEAREEGQPEQEEFGAEAGLWDSCQELAHFPLEVGHSTSAVVTRVVTNRLTW
jgi:hypothetical protein